MPELWISVLVVVGSGFNMFVCIRCGQILHALVDERRYREEHAHKLASALVEERAQ